ncbi:MAG: SoxR reducing system RseC family protein [Candidatus Borkfalkiaceae bacterium]|nr:SoxR reducing system RseC family protein [Christensenellaceae bacterium]
MTESGKVVKTEGKYATVRIDKKDECGKCGMCLFAANASYTEMRARNDAGAAVGDEAVVETAESGKTLSAVLVFLVPLLLIVLAAAIGLFIIGKEIWILLLSLIFILSWYTILGLFDKKLRKSDKFCARIVRITAKGEKDDTDNGQQ